MPDKEHLTPAQVITALEQAKGLKTQAARILNCHPATIDNYVKRYASVQAACRWEREKFIDVAEMALYSAVVNKEAWAVSLTLQTIGKDRGYVKREEQVHQGDKDKPLEIKVSNADAIRAAEDAYARLASDEPLHLGERASNGHSPLARADALPRLPVPKDVSAGS